MAKLSKAELEKMLSNPHIPAPIKAKAKKMLDSGDYTGGSAPKSKPAAKKPAAKKTSEKSGFVKKKKIDGEEWVLSIITKPKKLSDVTGQWGVYDSEAGDDWKVMSKSGKIVADGFKAESIVEEIWEKREWAWMSEGMKYNYEAWKEEQEEEKPEVKKVQKEYKTDAEFLEAYEKLNKGDEVLLTYDSVMGSPRKDEKFIISKGDTKIGKMGYHRMILKDPENPKGMKTYLYNRKGSVSLALGDMYASLKSIKIVGDYVEEAADKKEEVISIKNDGGKYYLKKGGDTTHFYMANSKDGVDIVTPAHIMQHKGEPYYEDVRSWLKGGKSPDGKEYGQAKPSKWYKVTYDQSKYKNPKEKDFLKFVEGTGFTDAQSNFSNKYGKNPFYYKFVEVSEAEMLDATTAMPSKPEGAKYEKDQYVWSYQNEVESAKIIDVRIPKDKDASIAYRLDLGGKWSNWINEDSISTKAIRGKKDMRKIQVDEVNGYMPSHKYIWADEQHPKNVKYYFETSDKELAQIKNEATLEELKKILDKKDKPKVIVGEAGKSPVAKDPKKPVVAIKQEVPKKSAIDKKLEECRKALKDADYEVVKKSTPSGRKEVRVKRPDSKILNTKMDSVAATIRKDVPTGHKDGKQIENAIKNIQKTLTAIVQKLDKHAKAAKLEKIKKIEELLKELL